MCVRVFFHSQAYFFCSFSISLFVAQRNVDWLLTTLIFKLSLRLDLHFRIFFFLFAVVDNRQEYKNIWWKRYIISHNGSLVRFCAVPRTNNADRKKNVECERWEGGWEREGGGENWWWQDGACVSRDIRQSKWLLWLIINSANECFFSVEFER